MKSVGIAGLVIVLMATSQAAGAKSDSVTAAAVSASRPVVVSRSVTSSPVVETPAARAGRWAAKRDGRWNGGWNAPGGWTSYRPASRGYALPGYWVNPAFYIGNYSNYGLARPQPGYGWSRYYDDAVLTDRDGRVIDSVRGVDWDRYGSSDDGYNGEDYSDSYGYRDDGDHGPAPRSKSGLGGVGGAVVGGAVGAIAGNVIAGKGDRLAGSLLGGGVGAVAGAAIASASSSDRGRGFLGLGKKHHHRDRRHDRGSGYDYEDGYGDYDRRGGDEYHGRYEGNTSHWGRGGRRDGWNQQYYRGGYGYGPEVTVVTVQSQPVTYTTTTTTEEVIYSKAATRKRHYWKPRPKKVWKPRAQCVCGS